jgi:hypothetical protein
MEVLCQLHPHEPPTHGCTRQATPWRSRVSRPLGRGTYRSPSVCMEVVDDVREEDGKGQGTRGIGHGWANSLWRPVVGSVGGEPK